jgi:hypothetical protein
MSMRRPTATSDLRQQHQAAQFNAAMYQPAPIEAGLSGQSTGNEVPQYDELTPVEQSVAQLEIGTGALKPIRWMNDAHYDQLVRANSLDPTLARRIEAYRHVAKIETCAA